jgi:5-methylcytosine-specific restriction endonuclease McrA
MKPCAMCDKDMEPRTRTQRFCSVSCAQKYRWALVPRKPAATRTREWKKSPESMAIYRAPEYRRARAQVVAAAIGKPCPGCGRTLTRENCQADHKQARAQGGGNDFANLRALCRDCNHRLGSSLGGKTAQARKRARQTLRY